MSDDPRHPFLQRIGMAEYPFPLSDGTVAELRLPIDLAADDAERLAAFVQTLVLDDECDGPRDCEGTERGCRHCR